MKAGILKPKKPTQHTFHRRSPFVATLGFLILSSLGAFADGAVSLLHTFAPLAPDGAYPWASLVQGPDGNFYGTTIAGGPSDVGTVFRVTPAGILTSLYSFTNGLDGGNPDSALIVGADGNFYGTAENGGSNNAGTVFRLSTSGVFTPLHSFMTNGLDGVHPKAALVAGGDGNFYGTTYSGGANGYGTVFAITPAGSLTILSSFNPSGGGGIEPSAPLVPGPDGNFYGTTAYGGNRSSGTVFKITPQGVLTPLHSFTYGTDGAQPWAALVLGTDGNFYGTTYSGGAYGYGTVFMITPDGVLTPLYAFTNGSDGGYPYAPLVQGVNGNFYGVSHGSSSLFAGTNSIGTIFEITPSGYLSTLYTFTNGIGGANPTAGLVLGTNGNFFGAAENGGTIGWGGPLRSGHFAAGTQGWGALFTLTPEGGFTLLRAFPGETDGANPGGGLIEAANGLFYGVTERGGTNDDGVVFQMTPDGTVTTLHSFTAGSDGAVPLAALTQGSDGNLYGTSYGGGPSGYGAVFRITLSGVLTPLHTFTNGADGGRPVASLVEGTNGNFYGTTTSGGARSGGTVFQMTPAGVLTTLHSFTNGSDGLSPTAGLVPGVDGQFYGTSGGGGTSGNGTIFKITAGGVLMPLYLFKGGADGANPAASLTPGKDGNFYGVCAGGGVGGDGTVFTITPSGILTPLYSFADGDDGYYPQAPLIPGSDGKFYGTTVFGGANHYGTMFQITTNGVLTTLHAFSGLESGPESYASLVQGTDGNFYIACQGSPYSTGTILRLTVPPVFLSLTEAGGAWNFSWSGIPRQKYQFQYTSSLGPANWTNLGNPITATSPVLNATDTSPAGDHRFYRIVVVP